MAGFGIKTHWTRQPQYPVGIDWSNNLTTGLVGVLLPSACIEAIKRTPLKNLDAAAPIYSPNAHGIGSYSTTVSQRPYADVNPFSTTNTEQLTLLAVVIPASTDGTPRTGGVGKASDVIQSTTFEISSGIYRYYERASNVAASSGVSAVAYKRAVLVGVSDYLQPDATRMRIWVDGKYGGAASVAGTGVLGDSYNRIIANGWPHSSVPTNMWNGWINLLVAWNRPLSEVEILEVSHNPWQIFQPLSRSIFVPSAGGSVSGTITATLDAFTSTISGTTTVTGTIVQTLAAFTSTISGNSEIKGTIAGVLQDDTSNMSGAVGGITDGTIAVTLQNDTSNMQGTTTIMGTLSGVLQNDTSTIQGTTTIVGAISNTLDNFISTINGFVGTELPRRLRTMVGMGE